MFRWESRDIWMEYAYNRRSIFGSGCVSISLRVLRSIVYVVEVDSD